MNPAEAVKTHSDMASRQSVAIHFGTFRLTEEAIDCPVLDLKAALARQDAAEDDFAVLEEGRTRIYAFLNNWSAKRPAPDPTALIREEPIPRQFGECGRCCDFRGTD